MRRQQPICICSVRAASVAAFSTNQLVLHYDDQQAPRLQRPLLAIPNLLYRITQSVAESSSNYLSTQPNIPDQKGIDTVINT